MEKNNISPFSILEKALSRELTMFMNMSDFQIENHIPNGRIKERVGRIGDTTMEVFIYSRDHDPPHFHVKSKDGSISVKIRIDDGSLISGDLRNKVLKRIRIWYSDIKTQILIKKVWEKRNQIGPTV